MSVSVSLMPGNGACSCTKSAWSLLPGHTDAFIMHVFKLPIIWYTRLI